MPVIEQAHPQPMPDQTEGHGVEDLAQGEAASARDADDHILEIGAAPSRKVLQMGSFGRDPLAAGGVPAPDDLVGEGAVAAGVSKVGTARISKASRIAPLRWP